MAGTILWGWGRVCERKRVSLVETGTPVHVAGGGYHVLQLLLEESHPNKTFAAIMNDMLHQLGMTSSGFVAAPEARLPAALAESRCPADGGARGQVCRRLADATRRLPNFLFAASSAAGLYSTASDFSAFIASHMDVGGVVGRGVLTPQTVAEMRKIQWAFPGKVTGWGLGYQLAVVPVALTDGRVVSALLQGHGGSNEGWKLMFGLIADLGVGFTIHTNGDDGEAVVEAMTLLFAEWLAGRV